MVDGGDVGVDDAAKAVRNSGGDAGEAGAAGRKHDGRVGGAAESFAGGGIGGIARLGEGFAGDGEKARVSGGKGGRGSGGVDGDDADGERRAEVGGEIEAGGDGFKRGVGECGAGFVGVGENENRFHIAFTFSGCKFELPVSGF